MFDQRKGGVSSADFVIFFSNIIVLVILIYRDKWHEKYKKVVPFCLGYVTYNTADNTENKQPIKWTQETRSNSTAFAL